MYAIVLDAFYSEPEWLVMAYVDFDTAQSDLNKIKAEIARLKNLGYEGYKVYSDYVQDNGVGDIVPSTLGEWFPDWTICVGDTFTLKPLEAYHEYRTLHDQRWR